MWNSEKYWEEKILGEQYQLENGNFGKQK